MQTTTTTTARSNVLTFSSWKYETYLRITPAWKRMAVPRRTRVGEAKTINFEKTQNIFSYIFLPPKVFTNLKFNTFIWPTMNVLTSVEVLQKNNFYMTIVAISKFREKNEILMKKYSRYDWEQSYMPFQRWWGCHWESWGYTSQRKETFSQTSSALCEVDLDKTHP